MNIAIAGTKSDATRRIEQAESGQSMTPGNDGKQGCSQRRSVKSHMGKHYDLPFAQIMQLSKDVDDEHADKGHQQRSDEPPLNEMVHR